MGWSIKIECQECNYQQRFSIGIGFYYLPEYIFFGDKPKLSDFVKDKKERKLISQLMKRPNVRIEGSESRLYRCSKCNHLSDKYYYCIKFDGGQHMPNYNCSNCGYQLELLQVNEEKQIISLESNGKKSEINCPECGSSKIICMNGCFDWD